VRQWKLQDSLLQKEIARQAREEGPSHQAFKQQLLMTSLIFAVAEARQDPLHCRWAKLTPSHIARREIAFELDWRTSLRWLKARAIHLAEEDLRTMLPLSVIMRPGRRKQRSRTLDTVCSISSFDALPDIESIYSFASEQDDPLTLLLEREQREAEQVAKEEQLAMLSVVATPKDKALLKALVAHDMDLGKAAAALEIADGNARVRLSRLRTSVKQMSSGQV